MADDNLSPIIEQRIQRLVNARRYDAARAMLQKMPNGPKKRAYLIDINLLETPMERTIARINRQSWDILLYVLIFILIVIGIGSLIGMIQFIQARAAL